MLQTFEGRTDAQSIRLIDENCETHSHGCIVGDVVKLLARGLSLIRITILARLLSPAEFGVVGLAMATLDLASCFSFGIVLI